MRMLDDRIDLPSVRRIGPPLPMVIPRFGQMPQVVDHARADKRIPLGIESDAPRIARPLAKQTETARPRVDAKHRTGELIRLPPRCDATRVEDSVEAIQSAVGPPRQTVRQFMRVLAAESRYDDLNLIRLVIPIGVLHEQNIGGIGHPHSTVPHGDSRGDVEPLGKDLDRVDGAVAVGILQNFDAIAPRARLPPRVFETLGDPNPAPFVETHRDRFDQLRLRGHQFDMKSRRNRHLSQRFLRRQRRPRRFGLLARNLQLTQRRLGIRGTSQPNQHQQGGCYAGRKANRGGEDRHRSKLSMIMGTSAGEECALEGSIKCRLDYPDLKLDNQP